MLSWPPLNTPYEQPGATAQNEGAHGFASEAGSSRPLSGAHAPFRSSGTACMPHGGGAVARRPGAKPASGSWINA
ncbi:protein of unknown function [Burkholderia multivorans]